MASLYIPAPLPQAGVFAVYVVTRTVEFNVLDESRL